jgi:hypothetical protein
MVLVLVQEQPITFKAFDEQVHGWLGLQSCRLCPFGVSMVT